MGVIEKALSMFGYEKSISTDNPYIAQFLNGGDTKKQINTPYSNVPAVYKSVKAIIDNASNVDKKLVNPDGEETNTFPEIMALFDNVKDETGNRMTFSELIQKMSGYFALYGECFFIKNAETVGELKGTQLPKNLQLVNPRDMQEQAINGMLSYWKLGTLKIEPDQVIIIKDFNPYSKIRGVSPVAVVMDELRIETGASEYLWSLFENGASAGMLIETERDMSPDQMKQFRLAWAARHKGSSKAGKIGLLSGGAKAKQFGMSNVDMELSELIGKAEEKIIGMWRVPKAMFGYTDNLNRATFLGQLNVFYTMTIMPMLNRFEDTINKEIVSPYKGNKVRFAFDYKNVSALQEQINDKIDTALKLQTLGFTRNEINEKLELGFEDNVEWGDSYYINFSQVPAGGGSIADYQTSEPTPTKELKKKSSNGIEYTEKQLSFIKNFNVIHDKLHKDFARAIVGYFNGLRKRTLDAFDDGFKGFASTVNKQVEININWTNEYDELWKILQPYEFEASKQGANKGSLFTGIKPSERLAIQLNVATQKRLDKVVEEINSTNKKQVNDAINRIINEGGATDDVKRGIKDYYNKTTNRAETIARTEVTAQLNGGLLLQYDDVGVEQKEWLTNIDEFTRESHVRMNGEIRDMSKPFSNGLMFAGDFGDPAETINCRCSVLPVMEGL